MNQQLSHTCRTFLAAMVSIAGLLLALTVQAANYEFNFPLEGSQEVPPSGSAGTGSCVVSLNDVTGAVSVDCSFSGLGSEAAAAHIHGLAPVGVNAGVLLALSPTAATSGTISGAGTLDASSTQGMINGETYINLHSQNISSGELRGQVVGASILTNSIPSSSTWSMILMIGLLGLTGVVFARRRVSV